VAVVALVVVLVAGVGLWLVLQPKTTTATGATSSAAATASANKPSTSAATKATTTAANKATTTSKAGAGTVSCSGGTIDATDYSAKVPTGWECGTPTSSLTLTDVNFDTVIVIQIPGQTDAATVCSSMATAGTVTALPDTQWGGKTAKTEDIASGNTKMHVRCVDAGASVYYLMGLPISGTYADVVAGVDGLTSGWTWK
jgi:cytoskeletal protein RodZ